MRTYRIFRTENDDWLISRLIGMGIAVSPLSCWRSLTILIADIFVIFYFFDRSSYLLSMVGQIKKLVTRKNGKFGMRSLIGLPPNIPSRNNQHILPQVMVLQSVAVQAVQVNGSLFYFHQSLGFRIQKQSDIDLLEHTLKKTYLKSFFSSSMLCWKKRPTWPIIFNSKLLADDIV